MSARPGTVSTTSGTAAVWSRKARESSTWTPGNSRRIWKAAATSRSHVCGLVVVWIQAIS